MPLLPLESDHTDKGRCIHWLQHPQPSSLDCLWGASQRYLRKWRRTPHPWADTSWQDQQLQASSAPRMGCNLKTENSLGCIRGDIISESCKCLAYQWLQITMIKVADASLVYSESLTVLPVKGSGNSKSGALKPASKISDSTRAIVTIFRPRFIDGFINRRELRPWIAPEEIWHDPRARGKPMDRAWSCMFAVG